MHHPAPCSTLHHRTKEPMNLADCRIPYFPIPANVLTLKSRMLVLAALNVYRARQTISLEDHPPQTSHPHTTRQRPQMTPYQVRQRSEVRRELVFYDVLTEEDGKLCLID